MTDELSLLLLTAASIGFLHTLIGPDHYLPFIVLARARQWTLGRTALITLLCGLGHVLSSIGRGAVRSARGLGVSRRAAVEARRGDIAAWLLISVGLVYAAWGLHRAGKRHGHTHAHPEKTTLTPWMLFLIFVLGPCEPLIPVLMYPAATASLEAVLLVAGVFAVTTLVTMTGAVLLGVLGVGLLPLERLEPWSHAMAGGAIALCGVGIRFLGL